MEEANTYGSSQHELRNYSRPLDIRTRTCRGKGACSYLGLLNNPSLRNAWTAFVPMKAKFGSSERSKHSIYSPLKGRTSLCSRKRKGRVKKWLGLSFDSRFFSVFTTRRLVDVRRVAILPASRHSRIQPAIVQTKHGIDF